MLSLFLRRSAIGTLVLALLFVVSCEDGDSDAIAKAQACLDKLDEDSASLATEAEACRTRLTKVNTQQGWIIQCSVDFLKGGLTTKRIVNAYKNLDGSSAGAAQKEAFFIGVMALDDTADADNAFASCKKSGVESLIFIASMARAGTYIASAVGGLLTGGEIDENKVRDALEECTNPADPMNPQCDLEQIGESVLALESVYCTGANASSSVCQQVNVAIENSGGTSAGVGEVLACLLQNPRPVACQNLIP